MLCPILSICIPTFNRSESLLKTILSITSQDIFVNQEIIEIIISDNCSTDDTFKKIQPICEAFPSKIKYHCNDKNIKDSNFEVALRLGTGKYRKLHNDTLAFVNGSLQAMINIINGTINQKPIIFFLNGVKKYSDPFTICNDADAFLQHVSYQSTWIGSFGLWKEDLDKLQSFSSYTDQLAQTDILYEIINRGKFALVVNQQYFIGIGSGRKGGYNIAEVFGQNYLSILKKYVDMNKISNSSYENEKKTLLNNHIIPYYFNDNHDFIKSGFLEFTKDYGSDPYFYDILFNLFTNNQYINTLIDTLDKKKIIWRSLNTHNETTVNNSFDLTKVKVGKKTYGSLNISTWGNDAEYLEIGHYVSIGGNVQFLLGGNHRYDTFSTFPFRVKTLKQANEATTKGSIKIESDVWIGNNVTILSGVTIGQGAVIGTGSVVAKNIPAYAIAVGNPAKIVKYRFSDEIIKILLTFNFSTLDDEQIKNHIHLLYEKIDENNIVKIMQEISS